jgi:glycosyltransferase involved in cell wall biosynthesis
VSRPASLSGPSPLAGFNDHIPMTPLTLALDVGPLYGHRTGVAVATEHLLNGLTAHPDITVVPYLLSARATPRPGDRRLPLPAAAALRLWAQVDHPRVDRWFPQADVLHGTNYVAPPSRIPRVISVYDCWFLMHPEAASPAVNRSAQVLRRAVASGAHLHVSSHATAAVAAEILDTDRISVVHLGPPAAFTPDQNHSPVTTLRALSITTHTARLIIAIGTVERRKDISSLVAAFAMIASDLNDVELVIAGAPGDDQTQVEAEIDALAPSLRTRIHLLGSIDQATKAALLSAATVLAYPSLDEGFGFPILEAQQAEVAVVARPSGSIPEVGGHGVYLTADHTVSSLAAALATVLGDDHLRHNLVEAGTDNLRRFSWARCVAEMLDLYQALRSS